MNNETCNLDIRIIYIYIVIFQTISFLKYQERRRSVGTFGISNRDISSEDFYIGREIGKGKPINNQSEKYRSQYHSFDTSRNIVPATKIKHND